MPGSVPYHVSTLPTLRLYDPGLGQAGEPGYRSNLLPAPVPVVLKVLMTLQFALLVQNA